MICSTKLIVVLSVFRVNRIFVDAMKGKNHMIGKHDLRLKATDTNSEAISYDGSQDGRYPHYDITHTDSDLTDSGSTNQSTIMNDPVPDSLRHTIDCPPTTRQPPSEFPTSDSEGRSDYPTPRKSFTDAAKKDKTEARLRESTEKVTRDRSGMRTQVQDDSKSEEVHIDPLKRATAYILESVLVACCITTITGVATGNDLVAWCGGVGMFVFSMMILGTILAINIKFEDAKLNYVLPLLFTGTIAFGTGFGCVLHEMITSEIADNAAGWWIAIAVAFGIAAVGSLAGSIAVGISSLYGYCKDKQLNQGPDV